MPHRLTQSTYDHHRQATTAKPRTAAAVAVGAILATARERSRSPRPAMA
jgi:hypothetical protein